MKLSRDKVLEAALQVVERDGWDALSMRRLAQELDVWPMAVYRYFRDKDELLEALAVAAAERAALPGARGSWRTRLAALLREARTVLPPGAAAADAVPPGGARLAEAGIAILLDAGLPPAEAVAAWHALVAYTAAFAPAGERARARASSPPPEGHPALAAVAAELAAAPADGERFEYGLERLIDGVALRLPARR